MAERPKKNGNSEALERQKPNVRPTPSKSLVEPAGQGEDMTQAGEILKHEIDEGRYDPTQSTPKKIGKSAA